MIAQPVLQVLEEKAEASSWLYIKQISPEAQKIFADDVNSKVHHFRLRVPSSFITDYIKELLAY